VEVKLIEQAGELYILSTSELSTERAFWGQF
jgi:hypothetical protein